MAKRSRESGAGQAQLEARFEGLEHRLESRFPGIDWRFDSIDARFDALDSKLLRQFQWLVGLFVTAMAAALGGLLAR